MWKKFTAVYSSGVDDKGMSAMQSKMLEAINSSDMKTKSEAQRHIELQKKLMIVKMNRNAKDVQSSKDSKHYGFTHENQVMSSLKTQLKNIKDNKNKE